jgi:hypothetical protein
MGLKLLKGILHFFLIKYIMAIDFVGIGMLVTTAGAAISLVLKSLFQSRCTSIKCCCIGCERSVDKNDTDGL